jgi:hypothetical protein
LAKDKAVIKRMFFTSGDFDGSGGNALWSSGSGAPEAVPRKGVVFWKRFSAAALACQYKGWDWLICRAGCDYYGSLIGVAICLASAKKIGSWGKDYWDI